MAEMNLAEINPLIPSSRFAASLYRRPWCGCSYGLEHDCNWMLIDGEGKKLTQREWPRLATLVPHLEDRQLKVEVPGAADIVVPLHGAGWTSEQMTVDLWGHEHVGAVAANSINEAFSEAVGMSCRLLSLRSDAPDDAAFHDDAPLLASARRRWTN